MIATITIGDKAEVVAAEYLAARGHEIIAHNGKTKFCEIDIISRYNDVQYFVEVKYRKAAGNAVAWGAISPKKQRQMRFAAEFYALKNKANNIDMRLAAN